MRGFRRFVALIVFLGAAWATIPFFVGGRDKDSEDRLVGALNFVQEIIEDSYAEARKVDVFNSPSMDPQPQPNVWSVSGSVAIQDLAGTTIHEPYITIVENLCQAYAERRKPRNGVKALGLAAGLFAGLSAPAAGAELSVAELTEMERLLARLNFDPGQIDGVVDEWTRTAVRLYQEFAALPVDGVPSPVLLAELRQVTQADRKSVV